MSTALFSLDQLRSKFNCCEWNSWHILDTHNMEWFCWMGKVLTFCCHNRFLLPILMFYKLLWYEWPWLPWLTPSLTFSPDWSSTLRHLPPAPLLWQMKISSVWMRASFSMTPSLIFTSSKLQSFLLYSRTCNHQLKCVRWLLGSTTAREYVWACCSSCRNLKKIVE